ncbi:glycan metabolism protein RagB [Pedobacter sp. PACM 27299]|uniref:RagB/SusD family nutrient uptake outer membrane protein n=1 Tax=Pedobacter sp. PACM 27299 TaxID=1727164 RepID=UPI000705E2A4|nr:RagB/SusD family nutrient uptake outer membrane protein [Pedobacter sp. PACM 27299]ALL06194.1 glycan metabolism protein RagB [Pedobacter sp. PACM 27299]
MKNSINIKIGVLVLFLVISGGCTKLDQQFYDKVTPETFFKSKKDIMAALYRPFTHARWYLGDDRWRLQEFTADNFAITTKGRHWYNGGENERYHYHRWTPDDNWIWETWRGTLMGIALALDARNDLEKLDYTKFALSKADQDDHVNQLNTLIAYFYLRGLDFYGGLPIFDSLEEQGVLRSSDLETFTHIETLLKNAIEKLPAKKAGDKEEGAIRKAGAAAMLASLYFNAEAYIGRDMFAQCQQIAQDIVDHKYGQYTVDATWSGPHTFTNDKSPEIIWSIPSEFNKLEYNWFYSNFYHYNSRQYFGVDMGADNGGHLTPSRKPDGTLYSTDFKLGAPFEKFDAGDLRKKGYKYLGSGRYEGMFIVGPHLTPAGAAINGGEEYKDKPLNFVDQVGRFSEVGTGKKYASVSELPSKMSQGEENTGVRLVKVPIPGDQDKSLRWAADNPAIRLTEIYYMLAECKMRAGDKGAAATLINEVRKRDFANGVDPNPVTVANLDANRMLDEWSIEFLGEGRRRTDLIRWKMFTAGTWWDHQPSGSDHLNRFPVPTKAISGNNGLKQNPGY